MKRAHQAIDRSGNDLSSRDFQLLYGRWRPLHPVELRTLFNGAPFNWWIAGGYALTAAGAQAREHEDIDVAILARDLDAVREWLTDYHLWEAGSGSLRPLRPHDTLTDGCEQLWLRRDAMSPWLLDILLSPTDGEEWLFKRNHEIRRPLSDIGHLGLDGVTYLRPEIVLLFKARLMREKDEDDFGAVVSTFDAEARRWLEAALAIAHPGHHWLARLSAGNGGPIRSGDAAELPPTG